MVCLVYGFPNSQTALYWEWCWQHPKDAKGLREELHRLKQIGNQYYLKAKISIMRLMLTLPPWNRFPLIVHWLSDKHHHLLAHVEELPVHMSSQIGALEDLYLYKDGKVVPDDDLIDDCDQEEEIIFEMDPTYPNGYAQVVGDCHFCQQSIIKTDLMKCITPNCSLIAHIRCFALHFLANETEKGQLMPTLGSCPQCRNILRWPSLVTESRKRLQAT